MDRRRFIKSTSLTVLAASCWQGACKGEGDIPIIDTHQHLWYLDMFPLSWVKPPLDRIYRMEDYIQAVEGQNVVKAIYMEIGVPLELREKEALWALDICKDPNNPTVGAVINADPYDPGFETYMRSFEGNPYLKGIRHSLRSKGEDLPEQVLKNIRLLGELGYSYDINLPADRLSSGKYVLDQCPDTRFILDHCGNADPVVFFPEGKEIPREPRHNRDTWYKDMEELAKRPNIICKISGIVDNVPDYPLTPADLAPIINHCFEVFGPDRVIFAGDWPVCLRNMSLAGWITLLREVVKDRPRSDQRKMFHDNAYEFYGLKG